MAHTKRLTAREAARLNAIDCLYYGASRQHWNSCGLNPEEAERVWQEAREQLANEQQQPTTPKGKKKTRTNQKQEI